MQNLDFSNRIQKKYLSEDVDAVPVANSSGKSINPRFGIVFAAAAIFSIGIYTGFKISEITNIEKTIVKYPETDSKKVPENKSQNQSYTSFANPSPVPSENENSLSGKYLIKIGTFPDATADSLTRRLNNDPKLLQIKPYQCSGVEENVPERYIAFRTKAGNSGQNVFLGCFQKKWQALNAMKSVQESNINGTGSAQLFEIE